MKIMDGVGDRQAKVSEKGVRQERSRRWRMESKTVMQGSSRQRRLTWRGDGRGSKKEPSNLFLESFHLTLEGAIINHGEIRFSISSMPCFLISTKRMTGDLLYFIA